MCHFRNARSGSYGQLKNSSRDEAQGPDGAVLAGVADTQNDRISLWRGLKNLEKCTQGNAVKFSKGNCKVLSLGITFLCSKGL